MANVANQRFVNTIPQHIVVLAGAQAVARKSGSAPPKNYGDPTHQRRFDLIREPLCESLECVVKTMTSRIPDI